jgi:hypothetical protein
MKITIMHESIEYPTTGGFQANPFRKVRFALGYSAGGTLGSAYQYGAQVIATRIFQEHTDQKDTRSYSL